MCVCLSLSPSIALSLLREPFVHQSSELYENKEEGLMLCLSLCFSVSLLLCLSASLSLCFSVSVCVCVSLSLSPSIALSLLRDPSLMPLIVPDSQSMAPMTTDFTDKVGIGYIVSLLYRYRLYTTFSTTQISNLFSLFSLISAVNYKRINTFHLCLSIFLFIHNIFFQFKCSIFIFSFSVFLFTCCAR